MNDQHHLTAIIPEEFAGARLDHVLAKLFSDYSRTTLKNWILSGNILVDTRRCKPRYTVAGGERVHLTVASEPTDSWQAQEIALNVIYEDDDIIVINKPAGLVVHPGAGNPDRTLLNALLHHEQRQATLPRAGIVHRIDKDTSGILVVARSLRAHTHLVRQLQTRSLTREYQAVAQGQLVSGGTIDEALGRHSRQRTKMAVVERGREAITHFRIIRKFRRHTHIQVRLETGRTHQIRVHMAHLRHPLVGDPVYGGRFRLPPDCDPELADYLRSFRRQALHASRLALIHPADEKEMQWEAPLPADMQRLISLLISDGVQGIP